MSASSIASLVCLLWLPLRSEGFLGDLFGSSPAPCSPDACSWFGADSECLCSRLDDSDLLEHSVSLMFETAQSLRYLSDQMSQGSEALSSSANAAAFELVTKDLTFLDAAAIHLPEAHQIVETPVTDLLTAGSVAPPAGALSVVVEVWDSDTFSDEFVGEAGAPLVQGSTSYTLPLRRNQAQGGVDASNLGSVSFDVEATFTSAQCTSGTSAACVDVQARVACRAARGLPDTDDVWFSGTIDPYCVVRIRGLPEQPSSTFQTAYVDNSADPSWTSGNALVHSWQARAEPDSQGDAPRSLETLSLAEQFRAHLALLLGGATAHNSRTLEEEFATCPAVVSSLLSTLLSAGVSAQQNFPDLIMELLTGTGLQLESVEPLSPQWASPYFVATYQLILSLMRSSSNPQNSRSLALPSKTESAPTLRIPPLEAPTTDIDAPESPLLANCVHQYLIGLPMEDNLQGSDSDWPAVLAGSNRSRPEWVQSFWIDYETASGLPIWPENVVDFRTLFWRSGAFEDGLERALAFRWIGAHRVERGAMEYKGESLPWVVKASAFDSVPVRKHFGRYGGDMHFNADGLPIMIETPDGRQVDRNDVRDWQYWKFVWRSSLVSIITFEDHLHVAHFRAANVVATATRSSLKPDHAMRRLLSVFTYLTIDVNLNAMHVLMPNDHIWHRATPFENLELVHSMIPSSLPALDNMHEEIVNETALLQLPQMLQESPYFQDGSLLMRPIGKLIDAFVETYSSEWCDDSGRLIDHQLEVWASEIAWLESSAGYSQARVSRAESPTCADMLRLLRRFAWTVTGWHRHVGTVGDLYEDPDLAATSWREGESYARPLQAMTTSIVVASTGLRRPKLSEDYAHMLRGIQREAEALELFRDFRAELREVHDKIARRNAQRVVDWDFGYVQADPDVVECSVGV